MKFTLDDYLDKNCVGNCMECPYLDLCYHPLDDETVNRWKDRTAWVAEQRQLLDEVRTERGMEVLQEMRESRRKLEELGVDAALKFDALIEGDDGT